MQEVRDSQGEEYASKIAQNPFSLTSEFDVYRARAAAKQEKMTQIQFQKATPIQNRLNFAARNAMLSLSSDRPPKPLSNAILTGADPDIQQLARTVRQQKLDLHAPSFTGKYAHLTGQDKLFLEGLVRTNGAGDKLDKFLEKQKDIFLVELSLQTKQQEIDSLDGDVKRREMGLQQRSDVLDREIQQFDKDVRQSDQQTISSVLQQEQAMRAKTQKQEQIRQLSTQLIQMKSEINKQELVLLRFCKYRQFVQELLPAAERNQVQRDQERYADQRKCIALCCERFSTCDGLCLECFEFTPTGYDFSPQLQADPAPACPHANFVNYAKINALDQEFLAQSNEALSQLDENSKKIALRGIADPAAYTEYYNFPTKDPGIPDYTAVCMNGFVREPMTVQFNNSFEFMNTMRLIEANNFYLVENLQETDNSIDHQKQLSQAQFKKADQEVTSLASQLERLNFLNLDTISKQQKQTGMTDEQYNRQIEEIAKIDNLVKSSYSTVVSAISEQLRKDPSCEKFSSYSQIADLQSIGSLSMLSWMEGQLERLAQRVFLIKAPDFRFRFERQMERNRRKKVAQTKFAAKEEARKLKIARTQERSQEPIRRCDVRDVKFMSFGKQKRKIGGERKVEEEGHVEAGFYE
ncbi:hypothetical protein SS50377_20834 [Spironucleus salmonicida]|uniref:DUF4200 domain-containing protein n=1 Tax=Spironucleus salmonicida TaxID=348837 RepID=A0A9P8M033_9EUKA|nr:hypothetical protein SS50377_20834 [Spironucleus salmonicida]